MSKRPKIGRRPFRNNQGPETRTSCENLNGIHDETHRRANPVILSTPVMHQSIDTASTRRSKLGVKTQKLGTPFGIYKSKHGGIKPSISLVDKPALKISSLIE